MPEKCLLKCGTWPDLTEVPLKQYNYIVYILYIFYVLYVIVHIF